MYGILLATIATKMTAWVLASRGGTWYNVGAGNIRPHDDRARLRYAREGRGIHVGTTPTVLIVDDEAPLRGMLQDAMTLEGYAIELATNGQEAIAMLQQHPDIKRVMLLDLMMPILDGSAVVRWLIEHPEIRQNVRIVLMSGNSRLQEYAHLEHDAMLAKPFGMDTVLNLLSPM